MEVSKKWRDIILLLLQGGIEWIWCENGLGGCENPVRCDYHLNWDSDKGDGDVFTGDVLEWQEVRVLAHLATHASSRLWWAFPPI